MTETGEQHRPRPEELVCEPTRWRDLQVVTRPERELRKARRPIGVVKHLCRYPVTSMPGERLHDMETGVQGIIGDRAYTMHEANGRVITAKQWPTLLECYARDEAAPMPEALASLCITLAAYAKYRGVLNPASGVDRKTLADVEHVLDDGGAMLAWIGVEAVAAVRVQAAVDHLFVERLAVDACTCNCALVGLDTPAAGGCTA